jgi:hypothetical protein
MNNWILGFCLLLPVLASGAATGAAPVKVAEAPGGPQLLLRQLDASPIVEVAGVVDARGVNGTWSRGDDTWTLLFQFAGWRVDGGPLRTDQLVVRQLVEREEIDRMRARVQPYQLIRIRARLSEQNVFHRPEALLLDLIDANLRDAELAAHALTLQETVTLEDAVLGTLTLDRTLDVYRADASWRGLDLEVTLIADDDAARAAALTTAHALFAAQDAWHRRVVAFAIDKLLRLKNEVWLGEDESEFSARQFEARMRLHAISVYPDGRFKFWFDDGDLFWGHEIEVEGTLNGGPRDASIAG